MKNIKLLNFTKFSSLCFILFTTFSYIPTVGNAAPVYEDFEIRIIKNRFVQKSKRIGVSGHFGTVINSSFQRVYLVNALVDYHFTEFFGLELFGMLSWGFVQPSFNDSYRNLENEFGIFPEVKENTTQFGLNILLYPSYGKGKFGRGIAYFDTFVILGGGLGNLALTQKIDDSTEYSIKRGGIQKDTFSFLIPFANIGVGQHYFLEKNMSFNIRLLNSIFIYNQDQITSSDYYDKSASDYVADTSIKLFHMFQAYIGLSLFF